MASVKTFLEDVRAIIKSVTALPTETLINQLNQKITGWTNYYKGGVSSKVFAKIDFEIYSALERCRAEFNQPYEGLSGVLGN